MASTNRRETIDDDGFIRLFEELGGNGLARRLGVAIRSVQRRRVHLEGRIGRQIVAPTHLQKHGDRGIRVGASHPGRVEYELRNGVCLVGSDLHIWPGSAPVMHRAFVKFCKDIKPKIVVLNGDVVDLAAVSRHPPIGWESRPTVQQEIEAAQDRLSEIEKAAGRVPKIWTLGNHDGRFETRLAQVAPEYAKVHGIHLRDHFSLWQPGWSCWLNNEVVVKHRFRAGVHAPWNNTVNSGKSIVTGHIHSAKVTPMTDYNGTRYGVDTGVMADTYGRQFAYLEDNPRNWVSGFGVLTFVDGKLLFPELVTKWDDKTIQFRGELIRV